VPPALVSTPLGLVHMGDGGIKICHLPTIKQQPHGLSGATRVYLLRLAVHQLWLRRERGDPHLQALPRRAERDRAADALLRPRPFLAAADP
jgi:hypothetical protein